MAFERVAVVTGASRGIGRTIALALAKHNYCVALLAKTTIEKLKHQGTIHSVAAEVRNQGGIALPIPCDVRDIDQIKAAIKLVLQQFGRIDVVIHNAGAIFWGTLSDTTLKKYELLHHVNLRASFALIETVLPHFLERNPPHGSGHFIFISPPVYRRFLKGKIAYAVTKLGTSLMAIGLADELRARGNSGISVNCLWPATPIASAVTDVRSIPASALRKSEIMADAVVELLSETYEANISQPAVVSGRTLIDEDYLRMRRRQKGIPAEEDEAFFARYRCDPSCEPPRMLPTAFPVLSLPKPEEEDVSWTVPSSRL